MALRARDIMKTDVVRIPGHAPLGELGEVLLRQHIHGVPVEDGGRVVGVVSRSDVARQLQLERERFEASSAFYLEPFDADERDPDDDLRAWQAAGARLGKLQVKDVMSGDLIEIAPDASVAEVAHRMLERRVQRLLVMEDGHLLGVISGSDVLALVADGRLS